MTKEEIIEMAMEAEFVSRGKSSEEESELFVCIDKDIYKLANLVAAKAIKEALAQPEQEPVAYLSNKRQRLNIELKPQTFVEIPTATDWEMPLYMKPPQRTWVGLTKEEIAEFDTWHDTREEEVGWCNPSEIVAYIEDKLKEKNT